MKRASSTAEQTAPFVEPTSVTVAAGAAASTSSTSRGRIVTGAATTAISASPTASSSEPAGSTAPRSAASASDGPSESKPRTSAQPRQRRAHVLRAEPRDQGQPARDPLRIQPLTEAQDVVAGRVGAELDAERVVHACEELDVGALRVARPLPDPEHVRRAVVPVARRRVAPRERLLVVEQQALVRGPDVDLAQLRSVGEIDPAGGHEPQRAL